VAGLDRLFIGGNGKFLIEAFLALTSGFLKRVEEHFGICDFKMIFAHLLFVDFEHITVGNSRPVGRGIVIREIENAILILDIHGQTFKPVGELSRNRLTIKSAHLLEISELRDFHPVAPDFPAKAPGTKRRAFPIIFDKADVVEQRIDANRGQTAKIKLLQVRRAWLQDDLVLIISAQAVWVFAVATVRRAAAGLNKGGVPRVWAKRAQRGRGVERPGTHFHVIRLQDNAPLLPPIIMEGKDQILKAKRPLRHARRLWPMARGRSSKSGLSGEQFYRYVAVMKQFARFIAPFALAIAGTAQAAPTPPAKPALWVLSDEDTKIYLFGTVHVLPKGYQWRTPPLDAAMAESKELVLEVADLDDDAQTAGTFMSLAMSPGLPPVSERVPASKRAAFDALVAKSGIPSAALDQFESWAVALTLATGMLKDLGVGPDDGVEASLTKIFKKKNKPISGLETTEQQLGFFDTLPDDAQRIFLTSMVDDSADMQKEFDAMVASWAAGDEAKIAISFDDELKLSPELIDRLLRQRNANWTRWLVSRMERPGTVFMGVGAGHLAGPHSVQVMLGAKGLKVTRLQ
jgi:uncharacterized protein